jgi:hypothetical protein
MSLELLLHRFEHISELIRNIAVDILGRIVLGLNKVGLSAYILIVKEDDDRSSAVLISKKNVADKIQIDLSDLKEVDLYSQLHGAGFFLDP